MGCHTMLLTILDTKAAAYKTNCDGRSTELRCNFTYFVNYVVCEDSVFRNNEPAKRHATKTQPRAMQAV